jgi:hypothetical protein
MGWLDIGVGLSSLVALWDAFDSADDYPVGAWVFYFIYVQI